MPETPPGRDDHGSIGYERRDVNVSRIVMVAVGLCVMGALLHAALWEIHRGILPEARGAGVSPPVRMPGEVAVNQRIEDVARPRIEALDKLQAEPPSYRSSQPVPEKDSAEFHPEDLRADRQPRLKAYGWVDEKGGIAQIPIAQAMEVVVERARAHSAASKGAKP
jgi:hypothetical protein